MGNHEGAVVIFSGSDDSICCLAWAIKKWGKENVVAMVIGYGQPGGHEAVADIARNYDVSVVVSDVDLLQNGNDIGRNAVLMAMAANQANFRCYKSIVSSIRTVHDHHDCSKAFAYSMQLALRQALNVGDFNIWCPIIDMTDDQVDEFESSLGIAQTK